MTNNNIDTDLLSIIDILDQDCSVIDVNIDGLIKTITLEKIPSEHFCPNCGCRLISKGKITRRPNNQVLQDGFTLKIIAIGRRWKCSNNLCNYMCSDKFAFVDKGKKNTKIVDLRILNDLKDLGLTCIHIAKKYNVSDTYVHNLLLSYVDPKRLKLPEILSVDEVYLNTGKDCKYAMVLMDFATGEIVDILQSRREKITEPYFLHIPIEERRNVKYLVCDMYNPYVNFTNRYLPNASVIIDFFHVSKWLNNAINRYINDVKKRYQKRDRKMHEEKNYRNNARFESIPVSKEVYLLNNGRWVLLMNRNNMDFDRRASYNYKLARRMDTYDWINEFMALDDNFKKIREERNKYEDLNADNLGDRDAAEIALDKLIKEYSISELKIFRDFGALLKRWKDLILNSFTIIEVVNPNTHEKKLRRISNGPIESFNKKPSELRSQSRGISNFEFARTRLLWATRENEPILAVPKTYKEIHVKTNKVRGPYNKK